MKELQSDSPSRISQLNADAFNDAYNRLNKEQRQAVDTIEGTVLVMAGPGTGKTQILTLRIANILRQTDMDPESILALTFTDAAARNMRMRLMEMIGVMAYRVTITTFHSFADNIIQTYPEYFEHILGGIAMTPVDQIEYIQEILQNGTFTYLKPFGDVFFYASTILSQISTLKREGVMPDQCIERMDILQKGFDSIEDLYYEKGAHKGKMKGKYQKRKKQISKNKELIEIYTRYQEKLHETKRYDFADMLTSAIDILQKNDDVLLPLQELYQYILVDEHQDTNNAQNTLVDILANFHQQPNLFVVGDEKQSIFRFQGASIENFFSFRDRYPDAEVINLVTNYRSTQAILDGAEDLIPSQTPLKSYDKEKNAKSPSKVMIHKYVTREEELNALVSDIQKKIEKENIAPHDIAVIYRVNKDGDGITRALSLRGIRSHILGGQDIVSHIYTKRLIGMMRVVAHPSDDVPLANLIYQDITGIDPLDASFLITYASRRKKQTLWQVLNTYEKMNHQWENGEAFNRLRELLDQWLQCDATDGGLLAFEKILYASGIIEQALKEDEGLQILDTLKAFFDHIREYIHAQKRSKLLRLKDIIAYIDTLEEHGMRIKMTQKSNNSAVQLVTAHSAKGLEFPYVYIVHAVDGVWGNRKRREILPLLPELIELKKPDENLDEPENNFSSQDDERRLFYVAVTRAKQQLCLSYYRNERDKDVLPSQFITEISPEHVSLHEHEAITDLIQSQEVYNQSLVDDQEDSDKRQARKIRFRNYIRERVMSSGFSVSALNNYLRDPWLYFFRNIVRMPAIPTPYLKYGTAVHAVLQKFFENMNETGPKFWQRDECIGEFSKEIDAMDIDDHARKDMYEKGKASLASWYDSYVADWPIVSINEYRVNGVLFPLEEKIEVFSPNTSEQSYTTHVRLTGVLDRMVIIDPDKNTVRVTDYKTGKPKSHNELMGGTKNASGDYYRQLVFYKLLLGMMPQNLFHMIEGEIDFIEPHDNGEARKELFEIPDEHVHELKELMQKTLKSILNVEFWEDDPDPEVCEYHELVGLLRGDNLRQGKLDF